MFKKEKMQLFISFCAADRIIKDKIKSHFKKLVSFYKEKNVDLEIVEMDTHCPANWDNWMMDAVDSSDCVIAILTDNVFYANIQKRVHEEILEARNRQIPRIPFIITNDSELPNEYKANLLGCSEVHLGNTYTKKELKQKLDELFIKTKNTLEKVYKGFVAQPIILDTKECNKDNMPSKIFIGREEELKEIKKIFEVSNVVILHGQGGIGKTSLAKNFFFKYKDMYANSYIISAANGIKEAIAKLVFENVYQGSKNVDERYQENLRQLKKISDKTIIILDNVDCGIDKDEINNLLNMHCRFIITSRPTFDDEKIVKEIGPMKDEDLIKLIYMNFPDIEKYNKNSKSDFKKNLLNLIEYTGRHTLTIEMAAAIMNSDRDITLDIICEELLNTTQSCMTEHTTKDRTIFEHLSTLYNLIDLTSKEKLVLDALTLISPQRGIKRTDIKKALCLEDNNLINKLIQQTMIYYSNDDDLVVLHPLLAEVIFKMDCKNMRLKRFINLLKNILDKKTISSIADVHIKIDLLEFIVEKRKYLLIHSYKGKKILVNFILELSKLCLSTCEVSKTEKYASLLLHDRHIKKNKSLLENIYLNLGEAYYIHGKYKDALNYFLMVWDTHKNEDINKVELAMNIGKVYLRSGKFSYSKVFLTQSLEILNKIPAQQSLNQIHRLINVCLGNLYVEMGNYPLANKHLQSAVTLTNGEDEKSQLTLAIAYKHLGICSMKLGQYSKAISELQTSCNIYQKIYCGEIYTEFGSLYVNLAISDEKLREYDKAIYYLNYALTKYGVHFGEDNHPEIGSIYLNLGVINREHKNYEIALEQFKKSLNIYLKFYGEVNPRSGIVYLNLGIYYREQFDFILAEKYIKKAIRIYANLYEKDTHSNMGRAYRELGLCYLRQGNSSKALNCLNHSLEIYQSEDVYGNVKHPNIATTYFNLGETYFSLQDYHQAIAYFQKSIDMYKTCYGTENVRLKIAFVHKSLGLCFLNIGEYSQATIHFQNALEIGLLLNDSEFVYAVKELLKKYDL